MRLDVYLVEEKEFATRALAQDAIRAGRVLVNEITIMKPSYQVDNAMSLTIMEPTHQFASRGGIKLYEAIKAFKIDLEDKVVLDVGASTGGFSDVCLQAGAKHVFAVDVGTGQLLQRLKDHTRLTNMEGINCRYLSKDLFHQKIDFVCMDVSFISIRLLMDSILSVLDKPFEMVFLIKPQFEVGREYINKHGVVKNLQVHKRLLIEYLQYFESKGVGIEGLRKAEITGRSGNQEYIIYLKDTKTTRQFDINAIVK